MRVAGLMSGTSFDAIDAAVADFDVHNNTVVMTPLGSDSFELPSGIGELIANVVAGDPVTAFDLCRLDTEIGQAFADAAVKIINRYGGNADLVCSHGQTLYHWEDKGKALGSLQIGNPAWIAERTGASVISDLRARDIAAGGNGAPLVSMFDVMLANHHFDESVGFLNLGGIANITVIKPGQEPIAYDLGPANSLMDIAMTWFSDDTEFFDRDGQCAMLGEVNDPLLKKLNSHPYYRLPIPKSTGKETFGNAYVEALLDEFPAVSQEDILATFTWHVGQLVATEAKLNHVENVVVSGGGVKNPVLIEVLNAHLGEIRNVPIEKFGISASDKEAYAFAFLGFLTMNGLSGTIPSCTGAFQSSVLGSLTPGKLDDEQGTVSPLTKLVVQS